MKGRMGDAGGSKMWELREETGGSGEWVGWGEGLRGGGGGHPA